MKTCEMLESVRDIRRQLDDLEAALSTLPIRASASVGSNAGKAARIVQAVANDSGIPIQQVMSKQRPADVAWARFIACYFMSMYIPGITRGEIAAAVGRKDHGAACHGIGRVIDRMSDDSDFAQRINHMGMTVIRQAIKEL